MIVDCMLPISLSRPLSSLWSAPLFWVAMQARTLKLICLVWLIWQPWGLGDDNKYLLLTNKEGRIELQVGAMRLSPPTSQQPVLWLVATIHIGSADYYKAVQHFLNQQDLVLYEGIGDISSTRSEETFSIQRELARALGLKFQLDAMDYSLSHFHNCDITLNEFITMLQSHAASQEGQNTFNQLIQIMEGTGLPGLVVRTLLSWVESSPQLRAAAKLAVMELLGNLPDDLTAIAHYDPGLGQLMELVLIRRNAKVVDQLRQLLGQRPSASGPTVHQVAVLYGAGHMPLLEKAIVNELGYRPEQIRYFTAIYANPDEDGLSPSAVAFVRALARYQALKLKEEMGEASSRAPDPK